MSDRERLIGLTEAVPESMASIAFYMLKHYLAAAEEALDDDFCRHLAEEAMADPDKGDLVSFEDVCALAGVAAE